MKQYYTRKILIGMKKVTSTVFRSFSYAVNTLLLKQVKEGCS